MWQAERRGRSLHLVLPRLMEPSRMGQAFWCSGMVSALGSLENELTVVVSDSATPALQALQAPWVPARAQHSTCCIFQGRLMRSMAAKRRGRGLVSCAFHLAQLTGLIMILCWWQAPPPPTHTLCFHFSLPFIQVILNGCWLYFLIERIQFVSSMF